MTKEFEDESLITLNLTITGYVSSIKSLIEYLEANKIKYEKRGKENEKNI